jgi:hypothetical protein
MAIEKSKKHTGKCFDCEGTTELVEFNAKKGTRIMKCQQCGLYHLQKQALLGGWTLLKASKRPDFE